MSIVLANNAHSTLSSEVNSVSTVLYITDTSSFPSLDVDEYFYATVESTSGAYEIVKVTQVNSGSFDVERGQEGTIAIPFSAGARVEQRITAQTLSDYLLTGSDINDEPYGVSWNGDSTGAPSRNAVYDKIESIAGGSVVSDTAYGSGWNTVTTIAPSKNAVYDKIESLAQADIDGLTTADSVTFTNLSALDTVSAVSGLVVGDASHSGVAIMDSPASTGAPSAQWKRGGSTVWEAKAIAAGGGFWGLKNTALGSDSLLISAADDAATFIGTVTVPDDAYASGWNGNLTVPTKNAVYDKFVTVDTALASYTAADVLSKLLTVDGVGSGLDADLLDGLSSAAFAQLSGATFSGAVTVTNGGLKVGFNKFIGDSAITLEADNNGGDTTSLNWAADGTTQWYARAVGLTGAWFLRNNSLGTSALAFDFANNNATFTGTVTVPDDAYAVSWNGSAVVPTKNAVYDKIESLSSVYQPLDADLTSWAAVTRAAGFDTFVATPSSANLAALLTDETGSGANVFATSPTLVTPILGTPTSGTLTNCTGLPIATGVSGLGASVATMLATFSSANIAAACTNETGSGSLVFGTSPTITTPVITFSTTAALTAGTNAQGQGAITTDNVVVTTAASSPSGVTLPTATVGRRVCITNKGANAINVYPATGGKIDALAINTSIQIPVNGHMWFNASSTTQWYSSGNSTFSAPTLGTPLTGTLTNCTGLPIATGVSGLGTGVATFLATPSSANLISAVTDETGTGSLVFATSPTLVTPNLGVATATSIQAPPKISSETTGALTSASRNCIVQCSGGVTLPAAGMSDGDSILIDPRGTARTITRPAAHTMYINNTDSATGTTGAHNVVTAVYHGSSKWTIQGSVT